LPIRPRAVGASGNRQQGGSRIDPSIHLEAALGFELIDHLALIYGCVV
jgi:hypothetical protein